MIEQPIMVRGFKGEPVQVVAVGTRGNRHTEIYRASRHVTIGFPNSDCFELDVELLRQLQSAFAAGNQDELSELWKQAQHFDHNQK